MSDIGKLLKQRRMEKNLSMNRLSIKADVSYGCVYNIESGRTKSPQISIIKKLAAALEINSDEMMIVAGHMQIIDGVRIGAVDAVISDAEYEYITPLEIEKETNGILRKTIKKTPIRKDWLVENSLNIYDLQACQVHGDSMAPAIKHRSILIIKVCDTDIYDGRMYVFEFQNTVYLRYIYRNASQIIAKPENEKFNDIIIPNLDEIKILGVGVSSISWF